MNQIENWFNETGWPYEMYDGIISFVLGNREYDIVYEGARYGYSIFEAGGAHPIETYPDVRDVIDWLEDGT